MRYRVLEGHHQEILSPGEIGEEKRVIYGRGCAAGDVFESKDDMLRHNGAGMSPKFALAEEVRGPESEEDLQKRILADQKKLDALRVRKTTHTPVPHGGENLISTPPPASPFETHVPSTVTPPPTAPKPAPTPHVTTKAESDAVRLRQLNGMSPAQLKEIAENDEIDVSKCKSKDDFVKAILGK